MRKMSAMLILFLVLSSSITYSQWHKRSLTRSSSTYTCVYISRDCWVYERRDGKGIMITILDRNWKNGEEIGTLREVIEINGPGENGKKVSFFFRKRNSSHIVELTKEQAVVDIIEKSNRFKSNLKKLDKSVRKLFYGHYGIS